MTKRSIVVAVLLVFVAVAGLAIETASEIHALSRYSASGWDRFLTHFIDILTEQEPLSTNPDADVQRVALPIQTGRPLSFPDLERAVSVIDPGVCLTRSPPSA